MRPLTVFCLLVFSSLLIAYPVWGLESVSSLHVRDGGGKIVGPVVGYQMVGDRLLPVVLLKIGTRLVPLLIDFGNLRGTRTVFYFFDADCQSDPFLQQDGDLAGTVVTAPGLTVYGLPSADSVYRITPQATSPEPAPEPSTCTAGAHPMMMAGTALPLIDLSTVYQPGFTLHEGCGDPAQWTAEYFIGPALVPPATLNRCEPEINHVWWTGSPDSTIPADSFSARWTKTVSFGAGTYQFTTVSDDGIRVWVDGVLIIDNWTDHPDTINSATHTLAAGSHTLKVEYFENWGAATAVLSWTQLP